MPMYLLDTNILSPVLKRSQEGHAFNDRLRGILAQNAIVLISPIVYYEILRGLHKIQAKNQIAFFEDLTGSFQWRDFTKRTWETAAELWAMCVRKGTMTGVGGRGLDCDVLIAAQAREHNAIVVTRNVRHFEYLGVTFETW